MGIESPTDGRNAHFKIWEVHETVLVFGCDNAEWTGYAFSSLGPSPESAQEDDEDENEDEDDADIMPDEDHFCTGGIDYDDQQVLDASAPIWDPRAYFIKVFAIRMKIIEEREVFLIRNLGTIVKKLVRLFMTIDNSDSFTHGI